MRLSAPSALLLGAFVALAADAVRAAPPQFNRPNRPTVSPYINLLNQGGYQDPAITYYGQIRPQQEFRAAEAANAQALRSLDKRLSADVKKIQSNLTPSGHATSFLNTGGYFPRRGR